MVVVPAVAENLTVFKSPEVVAFVDWSVVAKKFVVVALVPCSVVAKKFVEVPFVAFKFNVSSQPVVVAFTAERFAEMSAEPETEKVAPGVEVPTPTLPVFKTVKWVVVAKAAVELEMVKRVLPVVEPWVASIAKSEKGEVVPSPR